MAQPPLPEFDLNALPDNEFDLNGLPDDQFDMSGLPEPGIPEQPPPNPKDEPGYLSKLWKAVDAPLWTKPQEMGQQYAQQMEQPQLNRSEDDAWWSGLKGYAGETAGSMVSGLTSPLSIGTTLATMGAGTLAKMGLAQGARGANLLAKGLTAAPIVHGASQVVDPNSTPLERVFGGVEAAGGALGMRSLFKGAAGNAAANAMPDNLGSGVTDDLLNAPDYDMKPPTNLPDLETYLVTNNQATPGRALPPGGVVRPIGTAEVTNNAGDTTKRLLTAVRPKVNAPADIAPVVVKAAKSNKPVPKQQRISPDAEVEVTTPSGGWRDPVEVIGMSRAMNSAYDISAALRQGRGLMHTKGWWKAWGGSIRSLGSKDAFNAVRQSVEERPYHRPRMTSDGKPLKSLADEAGLDLDWGDRLTGREEQIGSKLAESIPVYGRGIAASNRAFNAFLNKTRSDVFESLVDSAKNSGMDATTDLTLARHLADYVNIASGRGKLHGKILGREYNLEQSAKAVNALLFSPRLIASRMQMVAKLADPNIPWFVRKQYMKSIGSVAASWATFNGVAKHLGGARVETDPDSSDFMKPRIGNTRFDPGASFQQYMVLLHRLASGEVKSSTSGEVRQLGQGYRPDTDMSLLGDFSANKLAPPARAVYDFLTRTKEVPFRLGDTAARMITPFVLQSIVEVAKDDPTLLPWTVPLDLMGMPNNTYGKDTFGDPTFIPEKYDLEFPQASKDPWGRLR